MSTATFGQDDPVAEAPVSFGTNDAVAPKQTSFGQNDPVDSEATYKADVAQKAADKTFDPAALYASVDPSKLSQNLNNPSGDPDNPGFKTAVAEYQRQQAIQKLAVDVQLARQQQKEAAAPKTVFGKIVSGANSIAETAADLLPHPKDWNVTDSSAYSPSNFNAGGLIHGAESVLGMGGTALAGAELAPAYYLGKAQGNVDPNVALKMNAIASGLRNDLDDTQKDAQSIGQAVYDARNGAPSTEDQVRARFEATAPRYRSRQTVQDSQTQALAQDLNQSPDSQLTPEANKTFQNVSSQAESAASPENLLFLGGGSVAGKIGKDIVAPIIADTAIPQIVTQAQQAAKTASGMGLQAAGKTINTIGNITASKPGEMAIGAIAGMTTGSHYGIGELGGALAGMTAEKISGSPIAMAGRGLSKLGNAISDQGANIRQSVEDEKAQANGTFTGPLPDSTPGTLSKLAQNPIAQPALAGTIFSLPFAAAADTPQEAADQLGNGMAFALTGSLSTRNVNYGARRLGQEYYASLAPDKYNANIQIKGIPVDMDSWHQEGMSQISPDQQLAIKATRGYLPGVQTYGLNSDRMAEVAQMAGIPVTAGIYDAPQITTSIMVNGEPQKIMLINTDMIALGHESGHYIWGSLDPKVKSPILAMVSALPPKILMDAMQKYTVALADSYDVGHGIPDDAVTFKDGKATLNPDLNLDQIDAVNKAIAYFHNEPHRLIDEYIAEQFGDIANAKGAQAESLAAHTGNKSLAQSLSDAYSDLRQSLGWEGRKTALGFAANPALQDKLRGILKDIAARRKAEGKITPPEPPPTPLQGTIPPIAPPSSSAPAPTTPPPGPVVNPAATPPAQSKDPRVEQNYKDAEEALSKGQFKQPKAKIEAGIASARADGLTETEDIVKRIFNPDYKKPDQPALNLNQATEVPFSTPIQQANLANAVVEGKANAEAIAPLAQGNQEGFSPTVNEVVPGRVSVPLMVTRQMENDLKEKGYSQEQINAMKPADAQAILNLGPLNNIRVDEGLTPKASIDPFKRTGIPSNVPPLSASQGRQVPGLVEITGRRVDKEGNIVPGQKTLTGRAINPKNRAEVKIANKAAIDSGNPEQFVNNLNQVQQAIADGSEVNFTYRSSKNEVEGSPTNQEREEAQRLADVGITPREAVQKTATPTNFTINENSIEPIFNDLSAAHAKSRAVADWANNRKKTLKANFQDLPQLNAAIDHVVQASAENKPVQNLTARQVEAIHDLLDNEKKTRILVNGYSQDKVIANAKNLADSIEHSNLLKDPALRKAYQYLKSGEWAQDLKDRNENMARGYRGDGKLFLDANGVDQSAARRASENAPPAKPIEDWKVQVLNVIEGGPSRTFYPEANANAASADRPVVEKPALLPTNPLQAKLEALGKSLYLARGDRKIEGIGNIIAPASETLRLDRVVNANDKAPVELPPSAYSQRAAGFMPRVDSEKDNSLAKQTNSTHTYFNENQSSRPLSGTVYQPNQGTSGDLRGINAYEEELRKSAKALRAGALRSSGGGGDASRQPVDRYTSSPAATPEQWLHSYIDHISTEAGHGTYQGDHSDLFSLAAKNGTFIPPTKIHALEPYEGRGGVEHDVYLPPKVEGQDKQIYKVTKPNAHGFAGDEVSYFKYVKDLNDATQGKLNIRVLGVTPTEGNWPSIVTKMNFIEGTQPGAHLKRMVNGMDVSYAARAQYLKDRLINDYGFEETGFNEYTHKDTGVVMSDAHLGNFIELPNGDLVPIDVHFSGDLSKPMFMPKDDYSEAQEAERALEFRIKAGQIDPEEEKEEQYRISDLYAKANALKYNKYKGQLRSKIANNPSSSAIDYNKEESYAPSKYNNEKFMPSEPSSDSSEEKLRNFNIMGAAFVDQRQRASHDAAQTYLDKNNEVPFWLHDAISGLFKKAIRSGENAVDALIYDLFGGKNPEKGVRVGLEPEKPFGGIHEKDEREKYIPIMHPGETRHPDSLNRGLSSALEYHEKLAEQAHPIIAKALDLGSKLFNNIKSKAEWLGKMSDNLGDKLAVIGVPNSEIKTVSGNLHDYMIHKRGLGTPEEQSRIADDIINSLKTSMPSTSRAKLEDGRIKRIISSVEQKRVNDLITRARTAGQRRFAFADNNGNTAQVYTQHDGTTHVRIPMDNSMNGEFKDVKSAVNHLVNKGFDFQSATIEKKIAQMERVTHFTMLVQAGMKLGQNRFHFSHKDGRTAALIARKDGTFSVSGLSSLKKFDSAKKATEYLQKNGFDLMSSSLENNLMKRGLHPDQAHEPIPYSDKDIETINQYRRAMGKSELDWQNRDQTK